MSIKLFLPFLLTVFLACAPKEVQHKPASSAAISVEIVDHPFEMEGLNRERTVRVYLPINYNDSSTRFPVLYMHDGQNLFDESTAYAGEWGVDESLNDARKELIVVGIDNGQEKRINEMSPWDHQEFGKGEGKQYLDFIVDQVKPFIDSTYRTKTDRNNTAMMGSSMGGLITHFAMYEYADFFSKVGIFSPSYWVSESIFEWTAEQELPEDTKIYLIVGRKEGSNMEKPAKEMADQILRDGHKPEYIFFENVKGGDHGEQFWRSRFLDAVNFLFN